MYTIINLVIYIYIIYIKYLLPMYTCIHVSIAMYNMLQFSHYTIYVIMDYNAV